MPNCLRCNGILEDSEDEAYDGLCVNCFMQDSDAEDKELTEVLPDMRGYLDGRHLSDYTRYEARCYIVKSRKEVNECIKRWAHRQY